MEERKEEIKKAEEKVKNSIDLNLVEEVMKNNEFAFDIDDIKYRVRKPNFGEKQETYKKRIEKQTSMLSAKNEEGDYKYQSKDDLIEVYKRRGIDIEGLDSKFISLEKKRNDLQEKLGKALKDKRGDNEIKIYENEIQEIQSSQGSISSQKAQLLEPCLENQLDVFTYSYLTYLIAEKFVEEKWIKLWNNYEEFKNTPGKIVNIISYYAVMITQHEV